MDATVHVDSKPGEGSIFTVKTKCPMLTSDHLPGQVTPGPTTQTKGNGPSILSGKHIAIVGVGALGGYVGGHLARAGHDVEGPAPVAVGEVRGERAKVEPSDHVPVWCELDVA